MKQTITATFKVSKELIDKGEDPGYLRRIIRNIQEDLRDEHRYIYIEYLDHCIDNHSLHPDSDHYIYTIYYDVE